MGKESEELLATSCRRSFLSLWSYPNPFTDRGIAGRKEGKELCDLLVVFGDDVIIFSDKSCAYPNTGDPERDWSRWYRRAVEKSVAQIEGAERWIKRHPDRVFVDKRCQQPLPLELPAPDRMRVHRIAVALGAGGRCRAHFGGGSGSLPIRGGGVPTGEREARQLFSLGNEGSAGRFVHVFDEVALNIVLRERDTIADFIDYLVKKEDLFANSYVMATGEEDLLAHYLLNANDSGHYFVPEGQPFDLLSVDESQYLALTRLPQFQASKQANVPSYTWDKLIEYFTSKWREGELVEDAEATKIEQPLRIMARQERLARRTLGNMVISALTMPGDGVRYTAVASTTVPEVAFGVIVLPLEDGIDLDFYRERRQLLMLVYGRSLRIRMPGVRTVVLLGLSRSATRPASQDLALLDLNVWSPEIEAETIHDMELLGLGAEGVRYTDHEFPIRPKREDVRRMRQKARIDKKRADAAKIETLDPLH